VLLSIVFMLRGVNYCKDGARKITSTQWERGTDGLWSFRRPYSTIINLRYCSCPRIKAAAPHPRKQAAENSIGKYPPPAPKHAAPDAGQLVSSS